MVHRGASAAAGLNMGCPTSEDSLHIARLFRGNISDPKPFGEPKRHLAMYRRTSWLLWNKELCPSWQPGLPLKVYDSRTFTPYSMPAEGVQPLGAYIKLRKIADKYKRREKILALLSWFQDSIRSCKKIFWCRNVKNSALFSGHTWTSPDIAGHRRIIGI